MSIQPAPKTKRGANRQYNAVVREAYRRLSGGTKFGVDLSTLRTVWRDGYDKIVALRLMYASLPN
jgi:hypothetical protein